MSRKKIFYLCALSLLLLGSIFLFTKRSPYFDFPLSEYIHDDYEGYMGKYFMNDTERLVGARIDWNSKKDQSIYIIERDLEKRKHMMWLCSKPLKRTHLGGYLFLCSAPYSYPDRYFYIKLEMVYPDESKKEKIVYVSIGDNKECIRRYSSIKDFEKHCNPKTNKDIRYLKLYNLHF